MKPELLPTITPPGNANWGTEKYPPVFKVLLPDFTKHPPLRYLLIYLCVFSASSLSWCTLISLSNGLFLTIKPTWTWLGWEWYINERDNLEGANGQPILCWTKPGLNKGWSGSIYQTYLNS